MTVLPTCLRAVGLVAACASLAGCAAYAPLPLPARPHLAANPADLAHEGVRLAGPLGVADVAMLAVRNNPELRAARARKGIAEAQVLQAGLLPNPQVNANFTPVLAGPGSTSAYSAGLSEDIKSLITLSARRRGAAQAALQVDAELLWQEWQVVGKSRLLLVDLVEGARLRRLLARSYGLLAGRAARGQQALARGDTTITTVSPDLVAANDLRRQLDDLDRLQQTRRHDLDALLGLRPDVELKLADTLDLPPLEPAAIVALLPTLADRRPDLVALQLGYRAENAKLRVAILSQFPNLSIGVTGGSDASNVRTFGPQVTLELPIFDRNQGNIAIERATRQQLHAEYAARLAAAEGEVRAMLADLALIGRQLAKLRAELPAAQRLAREAEAAFASGNLDERSYVDLVTTSIARQQEILVLEQSSRELRVAIATLIGAGMPPIVLPPEEPGA